MTAYRWLSGSFLSLAVLVTGCQQDYVLYTPKSASGSTLPLNEGHGVILIVSRSRNYELPDAGLIIQPVFSEKNDWHEDQFIRAHNWQVFELINEVDRCETWQIFPFQVPAGTYRLRRFTVRHAASTENIARWRTLSWDSTWDVDCPPFRVTAGEYVYVGRIEFDLLECNGWPKSKHLLSKGDVWKTGWIDAIEEDLAFVQREIPALKGVNVIDANVTVTLEK